MGRFTKRIITGFAAASLMAGSAFAGMLADFENGTNQNLFGQYWYFFDDNKEASGITAEAGKTGSSVVTSGTKDGDEVKFDEKSITSVGANVYGGNNAAMLSFKMGRTMKMGYAGTAGTLPTVCAAHNEAAGGCYDFQQFVGIGTNIAPDGATKAPEGFNSATAMSFWARGSADIAVGVKVQMSHITDNGDYEKLIEVGTSYAKYTVEFNSTDLAQPTWASVATFDKNNITKVAWQIQATDANATGTNPVPALAEGWEGTLYLDDIEIVGYEYIAPDLCLTCVGAMGTGTGFLLSDFAEDHSNRLGYWWYAYTDSETQCDSRNGEPSEITDGVDFGGEYGEELLVDGNGFDGSNGAYIGFKMGGSMMINGNAVQPFVGLGTDLFDADAGDNFYDATAAGATGIYIEYMTASDVKTIDVEVQDMIDALNMGRPESAVHYIKLPGTDGAWKSATIPFNKLMTHMEWDDVKDFTQKNPDLAKLNLSALSKIQFKYQGGGQGYMGINSVWFVGATNNVKLVGSKTTKATGLRATYSRGVVGVSWNAASSVASGKVSLINTKGRVVASAPIVKSGSKVTANLSKGKIPTGMYFVRVNAKDLNGKKIVQQVPVTIVK